MTQKIIEDMLKFTKEMCNRNVPNIGEIAKRNKYIVNQIADKFKISFEDAQFVFENNYDLDAVCEHFEI